VLCSLRPSAVRRLTPLSCGKRESADLAGTIGARAMRSINCCRRAWRGQVVVSANWGEAAVVIPLFGRRPSHTFCRRRARSGDSTASARGAIGRKPRRLTLTRYSDDEETGNWRTSSRLDAIEPEAENARRTEEEDDDAERATSAYLSPPPPPEAGLQVPHTDSNASCS